MSLFVRVVVHAFSYECIRVFVSACVYAGESAFECVCLCARVRESVRTRIGSRFVRACVCSG